MDRERQELLKGQLSAKARQQRELENPCIKALGGFSLLIEIGVLS